MDNGNELSKKEIKEIEKEVKQNPELANAMNDLNNMDLDNLFKVSSPDSEFYKALSKFFDDDIRAKTDIKNPRIITIIKMLYYKEECLANDIQDIPEIIDIILDHYYYLNISSDRKGRKEFFNALMAKIQPEKQPSLIDKLLRR